MSEQPHPRRPKFCRHCGAALPPGEPQFCIECGGLVGPGAPPPPAPAAPAPPAGGARTRKASAPATVRLGNARVEQSVIGGTVQLPTSGAIPPGLWVQDGPPGPADTVAVYPPLRAVKGGWSGLQGRGWRATGSEARGQQMIFRFASAVEWFPAPGCGAGLRLAVQIEASSRALEGRERRGFRYGLRRDGPMRVVAAAWRDPAGQPADAPLPQIQIMAPPRVPRVSDYAEDVATMPDREAALWAGATRAPGLYTLHGADMPTQQHTPVGRGITLLPAPQLAEQPWWMRVISAPISPGRYRVRIERPLECGLEEWGRRLPRIRDEARDLGLDLEPALAAEWWLDRYGYDGVIFSGAAARYGADQAVIAFRRAQIVQVRG